MNKMGGPSGAAAPSSPDKNRSGASTAEDGGYRMFEEGERMDADGRYLAGRRLGQGAFAEVLRVFDRDSGVTAVAKVLKGGEKGKPPTENAIYKLREEALKHARLCVSWSQIPRDEVGTGFLLKPVEATEKESAGLQGATSSSSSGKNSSKAKQKDQQSNKGDQGPRVTAGTSSASSSTASLLRKPVPWTQRAVLARLGIPGWLTVPGPARLHAAHSQARPRTVVPRFIAYCEGKRPYILMELLGVDLAQIRKNVENHQLSLFATGFLGRQLIECLRCLHEEGFIHRDVKPQNCALGNTEAMDLHLVDFGLAEEFDLLAETVQKKTNQPFRGTAAYASISALRGNSHCWMCDLEGAMWVAIDLALGGLPWRRNTFCKTKNPKEKYARILTEKLKFVDELKGAQHKKGGAFSSTSSSAASSRNGIFSPRNGIFAGPFDDARDFRTIQQLSDERRRRRRILLSPQSSNGIFLPPKRDQSFLGVIDEGRALQLGDLDGAEPASKRAKKAPPSSKVDLQEQDTKKKSSEKKGKPKMKEVPASKLGGDHLSKTRQAMLTSGGLASLSQATQDQVPPPTGVGTPASALAFSQDTDLSRLPELTGTVADDQRVDHIDYQGLGEWLPPRFIETFLQLTDMNRERKVSMPQSAVYESVLSAFEDLQTLGDTPAYRRHFKRADASATSSKAGSKAFATSKLSNLVAPFPSTMPRTGGNSGSTKLISPESTSTTASSILADLESSVTSQPNNNGGTNNNGASSSLVIEGNRSGSGSSASRSSYNNDTLVALFDELYFSEGLFGSVRRTRLLQSLDVAASSGNKTTTTSGNQVGGLGGLGGGQKQPHTISSLIAASMEQEGRTKALGGGASSSLKGVPMIQPPSNAANTHLFEKMRAFYDGPKKQRTSAEKAPAATNKGSKQAAATARSPPPKKQTKKTPAAKQTGNAKSTSSKASTLGPKVGWVTFRGQDNNKAGASNKTGNANAATSSRAKASTPKKPAKAPNSSGGNKNGGNIPVSKMGSKETRTRKSNPTPPKAVKKTSLPAKKTNTTTKAMKK
ncbi:unnamed protein product [Amoebophrya sp. A25]|nr:unnamed protein product [Amoebophrya sp. A25]|eukprot:GSA25T00021269001.1